MINKVNLPRPLPQLPNAQVSANEEAMAYAMGDPRMAAKQYDRGGLSRGKAQWNQSGIDSAQKMASSIAEAYSAQLQTQSANANANMQASQNREQFGQALGGLQQQNAYANQMANLQRQGAMLNLLSGLLR